MPKDEVIFGFMLYPKEEPTRTAGGLSIAAKFQMPNDFWVRNAEGPLKDSMPQVAGTLFTISCFAKCCIRKTKRIN
jgi:hypothetical protein